MDPSVTTNPSGNEFHVTSDNKTSLDPDVDVHVTAVPSKNADDAPTIIVDSLPDDNDLTVTPAYPNFPTDEQAVMEPANVVLLEPTNDVSEQKNNSSSVPTSTFRPSQQTLQLLDELKYLLKPTNSLASPEASIQASQETNSASNRRTFQSDEDFSNNTERLLIEGLTPQEEKSLDAAERRSIAARGQRLSNALQGSDRSRASTMQPFYDRSRAGTMQPLSDRSRGPTVQPSARSSLHSQSASIVIAQPRQRSIFDHLSGLFWAFLAAYAFSIILFLTKTFGIDLIFGFFLQMLVQTIAFSIYAFYKGYNLLGPSEHRIAMICRGLLIGIGVLTSFLAYYYITLPDLSAIRQTQVVLTIILSIFFLRERVTIVRIIAGILTIIAIIVLIRPIKFGASSSTVVNLTNVKTSWIPYTSSWNNIVGISFALCTAITYSIASIMNKIYFNTQHLHNTVLCFWSALSALIISIILLYVTHFVIKDAQSFPHDWHLFVGIALALASIFVLIANQKAIKRGRPSIVTLIYSTDIILALTLQNVFTHIKSDVVVILGCILILASVLIVCIEVFLMEKRKKTLAMKVAQVVNSSGQNNNKLQKSPVLPTEQQRLSI